MQPDFLTFGVIMKSFRNKSRVRGGSPDRCRAKPCTYQKPPPGRGLGGGESLMKRLSIIEKHSSGTKSSP